MRMNLGRITGRDHSFAPSVDKNARIDWIGEHLLNHLIGGLDPGEITMVDPVLNEPRHIEMALQEIALHGARTFQDVKLFKQYV